jgi:hypothetical protein
MLRRFAFYGLIVLAGCGEICAARAQTLDLLSTRSENPLSNLPSLAFNHIFSAHIGRFQRPQNITNVQPNLPISVSDDYNVVLRANVPLIDQPVGRSDRVYALSDTTIQALFTRKNPGSMAWGFGPAVALPTRTDDSVGFGLPGGGVAFAVVKTEGPWLFGINASHVWSIGEAHLNQTEFSFTTFQPFVNYAIGDGWAINFSSVMTANWLAATGQQLRIPLSVLVKKTFVVLQQPMSLGVGTTYVPVRPDNAAEWQLRAQYSLLFPPKN